MISLRRIDHVSLRITGLEDASHRWCREFGLVERERDDHRVRLACDDEPFSLELLVGDAPGVEHVAYELRRSCTLEDARSHFEGLGVGYEERDGGLRVSDPEGNGVLVLPYREPESRWTPQARPARDQAVGHPRKLGHVNFLTAEISTGVEFYTQVLGMEVTDWLGSGGVWFNINGDHHVMALVDKGYSHFHHLAFDVVDVGQMRVALDHLGRHGRWLGWGPVRHGVGGNIASYVRIVEEECFVELYCDMEQLEAEREPRVWPDNRYSSNTWGPLPPRSYFRFDDAAVESERESLEMQGQSLPTEVI
ncbi:VOC family protein [Rubrobacter aplysinae]|uniref:VOC family protein n=1 Tax=Rubrobacter aplysinae TaxID=909625 RepID=UPI00064BE145|nr:VOC family protein [Rubrobacter aplysinae]